MRKLHWLFMVVCLAVMPALQSCDDNDGYSNSVTSPRRCGLRCVSPEMLSDLDCDVWGTLWPVNTDLGWYEPVDGKRVITIFNPLSDGFDGYDHAVKLLRLYDVLTKEVETLTPERLRKNSGMTPVAIFKGDIGISGGYLNIVFQQNLPSEKKHRISLVRSQDDAEVYGEDGYRHLELRYNNYDDLTGLRSPGAVSNNLNSLNITSETQGIKLKINSEVNDEVELVFDFKNSEDNTKNIQELDLSKMQLK